MAKAKKSKAKKKPVAKKSKAKAVKKKAKKTVKRAAAKAPAKTKKSKRPVAKAKAKKPVKKTAPKKKKQIVGEGDYAASKKFDTDQTNFVKRNKAKIPALAKEAEAALEGPEGDSLRAAEQEGINRSLID